MLMRTFPQDNGENHDHLYACDICVQKKEVARRERKQRILLRGTHKIEDENL